MRKLLAVGLTGAAVVLAGCGGGGATTAAPSGSPSAGTPAPQARTLTVLAAASLTDVFEGLEAGFEAANPGVDVVFSFAGSSDLAQQVVNGAPADVFAAASDATMKTVTDAGLAQGQPQRFATNVLEIATAPGNPRGIDAFADLAEPGLTVVVCAAQVPCGAVTERVEQSTGVTLTPVSEEANVRDVLGRVTSGEADAGLVYATDVTAAGAEVTGVEFPEAAQAVTNYPIAGLTDAPQPELATAFVELITGPQGQQALQAAGFGAA